MLFHLLRLGFKSLRIIVSELIAYQNPFTKPGLFYWGRQAKNSTAEIDYLIESDAQIVPIEIKSGSTGRMKSMHLFMDYYHSKKAVKISQAAHSPEYFCTIASTSRLEESR